MTYAITDSGKTINLVMPSPESIDIRDVAVHLACTNRFNGATVRRAGGPYNDAQHSVIVSRIAQQIKARNPLLHLQALLHDAHEYVTGDITTPMQLALGDGRENLHCIQRGLDVAIYAGLGVPMPNELDAHIIHAADAIALATEWRDMMPGPCPNGVNPANFSIKPLPWDRAEELFLKTFHSLSLAAGITMPKFSPVPTGIIK